MSVCLCVQLAIAKNNIIKLQEENQQLRSENSLILRKAQQHLEVHMHTYTRAHILIPTTHKTEINMVSEFSALKPKLSPKVGQL